MQAAQLHLEQPKKFVRKRALVVDDDIDTAELFAELLHSLGEYSVRVAFNADSALALALEFTPQVALLDIGMPGKDGFDLIATLRAQESLGACRFIAITGYAGEAVALRAHRAGFAQVLVKPIYTNILLDSVLPGGRMRT